MNDLPGDWSEQIQRAFPKRSGPSGWKGMRLMLAIRRALIDSTFEQVINGCENYKTYCRAAGIEGTGFVQAPQRFIEDGSFAEEFIYKVPEDPKVIEHRAKETERFTRACEAGIRIGLIPEQGECAAAFETRIRMQEACGRAGAKGDSGRHSVDSISNCHGEFSGRLSSLADRMRISK